MNESVAAPATGRSSQAATGEFLTLKTIFIVLDLGAAIRNILRTDTFQVLREQKNLRIVIFSPITDDEFKAEFAGPNIIIEPVPKWKGNAIVRSLRSYRKDVWSDYNDVVRYKEKRLKRKQRFRRKLLDAIFGVPATPEDAAALVNRLLKWEYNCTPQLCKALFEKYRPDLVFFTTMYAVDISLEIGAAQRRIETCAFILSWDNPTTKGPFQVRPDTAIVWNNIMRDELVRYHKINPGDIFVSGPPQFDVYRDRANYCTPTDFFKKWGLDPAKKLITFTTGSVAMLPFEHEIVDQLYNALQKGAFKDPCQLLVRLHPKDIYEPYRRFEGKPGLILQSSGRKANTRDTWNPTREDMYGLGETMLYSDVVLNIASTITIDAAAHDRPIVNLAWDGFSQKQYSESCERYYAFDHYKKIVETGGVVIARSLDEAVQATNRYLENPALEAAGRAKIREEQCHNLDGKSGQRIAEYLLQRLRLQEPNHDR